MKSIFLLLLSFLFVAITSVSFATDVKTTKKAKVETFELNDVLCESVISIATTLKISNHSFISNEYTMINDVNVDYHNYLNIDSVFHFDILKINQNRYIKPNLRIYSSTRKKEIIIPYLFYGLDNLYLNLINYINFQPDKIE